MKVVNYAATRNIYYTTMIAMKSLLVHNKIDKIYFFIEDDVFPYPLPNNVECINVSKQTYYPRNCINANPYWGGYMDLTRTLYTKFLPNESKILNLDVDTIVQGDISELWDYDLTDYYIAGVRDTPQLNKNGLYINFGVCMWNLIKIREDHKDDELINLIRTKKFRFGTQDSTNIIFKDHILELPSKYNSCPVFQGYTPTERKIIHFAGNRKYLEDPITQKYKKLLDTEGL